MIVDFAKVKNGYLVRFSADPSRHTQNPEIYVFKTWQELVNFIELSEKLLTGELR